MNEIAFIIGILGFVATLVGSTLAFFTFVNPKVRLRYYLGKPEKWERFDYGMRGDKYHWRYIPHPEFTITVDEETKEWDREEPWMKNYHLANKRDVSSQMVYLNVNGQIMHSVEFISLDGGRYFVPLPWAKYAKSEKDNYYYYSEVQRRVSRIIGEYYRFKTLEEFIEAFKINHNKPEEEKKES